MRIRWKLLILLLAISLIPLVVVTYFANQSTYRLGKDIGTRTRRVLTERAAERLQLFVDDQAALVGRDGQLIAMSVRLQANAVEKALAAEPPKVDRVYFSDDYDTPGKSPDTVPSSKHIRADEDGTIRLMPVSYNQQVFKLAPGVDMESVRDDIGRLALVTPFYRELLEKHRDLFYWQYTSLESGVHSCYPGHGGYPKDFDPRKRSWYQDAKQTNDFFWTPPYAEVSTRQLTLTAGSPVRRPDGTIAGYTCIDVSISDIMKLGRLLSLKEWDAQAKLVLLAPPSTSPEALYQEWDLEGAGHGEIDLFVIAQPSYEGVQKRLQAAYQIDWLKSKDQDEFHRMKQDMLEGKPGVRTMDYEGRSALWGYAPSWQSDAGGAGFLVVIVPQERIITEATQAENAIIGMTQHQLMTTAIAFAVVTVIVIVVAIVGSRAVTLPVQRLAQAASQIASGNLDARVTIKARDELGELGRAFNEMVPQLQDRVNLRQSLSLAMEVQQNLLPGQAPTIEGLDIAGKSIYCDETGGDYYDYLDLAQVGPHALGVAVGDVTGHGIAAALLMTTARALLRSRVAQPGSLSEIMNAINRPLAEDTPASRFMTLFYMVVDGQRRKARWVSAGHDPAITYHQPTDSFGELVGHDIPLGIDAGWQYTECGDYELRSGEVLVIGTDGIWESENPTGQLFGKNALREVIRQNSHRSAAEIGHAVTEILNTFRQTLPQRDDVTLVVIKVL